MSAHLAFVIVMKSCWRWLNRTARKQAATLGMQDTLRAYNPRWRPYR